MFLAGQTGAWYAGALPANYRSVATSTTTINDQDSAPLLNAGYIQTESQYGTNDATNRIPYLVENTSNTFGTGTDFLYSGWVYLHSEYWDKTSSGQVGEFYMYGRGTGDFSADTANGPDLFNVRMMIYGDSGQPTVTKDTVNNTSGSARIKWEVTANTSDDNPPQAATIAALFDSDETNWENQWVNITFMMNLDGSFAETQLSGGNTIGFQNNGTQTFTALTRADNAYQQIMEEGFGTNATLDMDTSVHSEHMAFVSQNYATNFTNSPRLGPVMIGTTKNINIRDDATIRGDLGTYVGASYITNPLHHLPFIGSTDADRLKNRGSLSSLPFDEDTTGTIASTGTFQ